MTKIKLFDKKLTSELGILKVHGYAGGNELTWKEDLMSKNHELILKIIHEKLDGKVLVFHNSVISKGIRATTYGIIRVTIYGIIRSIRWDKKYKTCFRIEYTSVCLEAGNAPCIRIMEDDSVFVNPDSCFDTITKDELDKLIDSTFASIKERIV